MFKAVSTLVIVIAGTATAQQYHDEQHQYGYQGQPQRGGQYGYGHEQQGGQYGYQRPHKFHKPGPLIDPNYYKTILSTFKGCKAHKCDKLGRGYSYDIKESISTLGAYTSCITACAADEAFRAIQDLKSGLAKINDIGFAQLVLARKYLSGQGDYDVLEKCTRIDGSCCLPEDYFTAWERIMIPVEVTGVNDNHHVTVNAETPETSETVTRMVSVDTYLKKCTADDSGLYVEWLDRLRFNCDTNTARYLELMQRNIGHLVLAPKCVNLAPDGSCNEVKNSNPRAEEFSDDMCVARHCAINGKTQPIEIPIVKPVIETRYWKDSCPSEQTTYVGAGDSADEIEIKYERIPSAHLKYFTITTGLPKTVTPVVLDQVVVNNDVASLDTCEYTQGIAAADTFEAVTFDEAAIAAAKVCPYTGLFEFCNMQQYATYLQKQLFDNDNCQVVDMRDVHTDQPQYYGTLACLYKITSLKCDCMQAVLNCYEREFHFTKALSKTIGKAASILCGFLLCQRPSVYSLFGGQGAIEKARIMRELMSQVGLSVPTMASMPPATFAFLSFGLGMVAFVTTKYIAKKSKKPVSVEDGYRNLI